MFIVSLLLLYRGGLVNSSSTTWRPINWRMIRGCDTFHVTRVSTSRHQHQSMCEMSPQLNRLQSDSLKIDAYCRSLIPFVVTSAIKLQ